jgi:hypothetical protein
MVEENSTPPFINKQAVKTKLKQAEKSIQLAIEEVSLKDDEVRLPMIHSCISCAHSYLIEASANTGKKD